MALPGVWLEGNLRNYVTAGLGEVGLPLSTETPVVAEDVVIPPVAVRLVSRVFLVVGSIELRIH